MARAIRCHVEVGEPTPSPDRRLAEFGIECAVELPREFGAVKSLHADARRAASSLVGATIAMRDPLDLDVEAELWGFDDAVETLLSARPGRELVQVVLKALDTEWSEGRWQPTDSHHEIDLAWLPASVSSLADLPGESGRLAERAAWGEEHPPVELATGLRGLWRQLSGSSEQAERLRGREELEERQLFERLDEGGVERALLLSTWYEQGTQSIEARVFGLADELAEVQPKLEAALQLVAARSSG